MILANDPRGFSCGEIHALFQPFRTHHLKPLCGCGNPDCKLWTKVKNNGENRLYESIFELFPEIDFIVDSSKDPFWINRQAQRLRKSGITVKHILIWKTPAEMAASCKKRGHEENWARKWINYHRLYFSLVKDIVACPYKLLATEPIALQAVCQYLGIEYFEEKKNYWEKRHHTMFGNTSAKIHTRRINDENYNTDKEHLINRTKGAPAQLNKVHRTIHYNAHDERELTGRAEYESNKLMIKSISTILGIYNVIYPKAMQSLESDLSEDIKFGSFQLSVRRIAKMPLFSKLRYFINRPGLRWRFLRRPLA